MKKKLVVIVSCVLFFIFFVMFAIMPKKVINNSLIYTTVNYGSIEQVYHHYGYCESDKHYQFFNGLIISLCKNEQQRVKNNEVILKYKNETGEEVNLVSEYDGFIEEINSNYVLIYDNNYYLSSYLPYEKYKQLNKGDYCVYQKDGNYYTSEIIEKTDLIKQINGNTYYEVHCSISKDISLIRLQKLNIDFTLKKQEGCLVDKDAIYFTNSNCYLIDSNILDNLDKIERSLIEVNIIGENNDYYLLANKNLENKKVCIISEVLLELLKND